jgi:hypothetical protein
MGDDKNNNQTSNTLNLESILDKSVDWLKFAEAKNGVILALNGAILFGISRLALGYTFDNKWLAYYALMAVGLLLVSILIALLSFIPRLEAPFWMSYPSKPDKFNVIFFGHICTTSVQDYLNKYYETLEIAGVHSKLDNQFANQIVINSKVAFIKFKQFEIAIWFTIAALLTPVGAFILAKVKF